MPSSEKAASVTADYFEPIDPYKSPEQVRNWALRHKKPRKKVDVLNVLLVVVAVAALLMAYFTPCKTGI